MGAPGSGAPPLGPIEPPLWQLRELHRLGLAQYARELGDIELTQAPGLSTAGFLSACWLPDVALGTESVVVAFLN